MKKKIATFSYSLQQIDSSVKSFWDIAQHYNILLFSGQMGAGKTTFINYLCQYLQIADTVSSPTFSLINEYTYKAPAKQHNSIFHIDLYRLNTTTEAVNAGVEDCIIQANTVGNHVLVEWPEKIIDLIPKPYLWMQIENINETERCMEVYAVE